MPPISATDALISNTTVHREVAFIDASVTSWQTLVDAHRRHVNPIWIAPVSGITKATPILKRSKSKQSSFFIAGLQCAQRRMWGVMAAVAGLLTASCLHTSAAELPVTARHTAPTLAQAKQRADGIAVPFEVNQGQFAAEVAFGARTFAGTLFITRDGTIVHALTGRSADGVPRSATIPGPTTAPQRGPGWSLVEKLDGALPLAPSGQNSGTVRVNRFQGSDPTQWHKDIATFSSVDLGQAWPGIGVSLAAHGSNVEKLFTVAPGADPDHIRLSIDGTDGLRLAPDGALIAGTGHGDVAFTAPIAFQHDSAGTRVKVPVHYALLADRRGYRFEVGDYDRTRPLVIDPLLQATYLGGSAADEAFAIALDADGNILVGGFTASSTFPGTTGGLQSTLAGSTDGFVSKFSSNLTTLLQTTYLGGSSDDQIRSMRVDAAGNIYVGGNTSSTDFPSTVGGLQPAKAGGVDAFIAKLSGNMATLQQATYLGGGGDESDGGLVSMAFDAGGNLLVAGTTQSGDFPGRTGGGRPNHAGARDAYISRVTSDLTTLLQSTYYGGSGLDFASVIAVDGNGKVLITGVHNSTNLPMPGGGAQVTNGGTYDGYIARFSADLTTLEQATYFGGNGDENTAALALDSAGHVFIAGYTASTNLAAGGSAQSAGGGSVDVFVARLSADLSAVQKVTYYGGNGFDLASTMVIDAAGNVIVAGTNESSNLPGTASGYQSVYSNNSDGFIAKFNNDLTVLTQATYFGGSGREDIRAILIDGGGNYVIAGTTASNNLTGTTGGAQPVFGGGATDAFVARFTANLLAAPIVSNVSPTTGPATGSTSVVITGTNLTGATAVSFGGSAAASFTVNSATQITATTPAHVAGAVNLAVTTAGGTATSVGAFSYAFSGQSISFGTAPSVIVGGTGTVSTTGGASGNARVYASTTVAACTVNSSTGVVTGVIAGTNNCTITANQAGNASYSAAPQASQSFGIGAAPVVAPPPTPSIALLPVTIAGMSALPAILNMADVAGPDFMAALVGILSNTQGQPLQFVEQNANGTVILRGFNGGNLAFIPYGLQTGDNRADGIYPVGNGQYQVVRNGQQITMAPTLVSLNQLTALLPGIVASQAGNGVITATLNGVTYVVQAGAGVQLDPASGAAQLVVGADGLLHFIDAQGNNQVLYPALSEPGALRNILRGLDLGSTLSIQLDGTAVIVLNGQRYTLVPDLTLLAVPAERAGQDWWQESATRYRVTNVETFPWRVWSQGFTVRPQ